MPKDYVELSRHEIEKLIRKHLDELGYVYVDGVKFDSLHNVKCETRPYVPIIQRIHRMAEDRYAKLHDKWSFRVRANDKAYDDIHDWSVERNSVYPIDWMDTKHVYKPLAERKSLNVHTFCGEVKVTYDATVDYMEVDEP